MQVGIVGMAVHELGVSMCVGMRLDAVPGEIVLVPMMLVVRVRMDVLHRFVNVAMRVALAEMQPDPSCHEQRCNPEGRSCFFTEQCKSNRGAEERRDGEVCRGTRRAEIA